LPPKALKRNEKTAGTKPAVPCFSISSRNRNRCRSYRSLHRG